MDRYLEALEQARNYYQDNLFLDTIFPELAESEDERIRKWLVELVKNTDTNHSNIKLSENCKLALAYLEKQKEQPAEWSEEDRKMIQSIITNGCVDDKQEHWLRLLPERIFQPKQEWSEDDKETREEVIGDLCALKDWIIKYDANWLANPVLKNIDKRISWLKSLPERYNLQPKVEWGEEDEKNWNEYIERLKSEYSKTPNVVLWDDINWLEALHNRLKFLRPQPHWKPSEEQMVYLKEAINKFDFCDAENAGLQALYEQLKKL